MGKYVHPKQEPVRSYIPLLLPDGLFKHMGEMPFLHLRTPAQLAGSNVVPHQIVLAYILKAIKVLRVLKKNKNYKGLH